MPERPLPGSDGVILLGHGSRAPQAAELLDWVAAELAGRLPCPVAAASLQFNRPTLEECCRQMASAGGRRIVVAPYFLFEGNHMQKDIPGELAALESRLPGVRIILARPLGADGRLVDVIRARVMAALGAPEKKAALPSHPIERQSFDIIDSLLGKGAAGGGAAPDPEYEIVRRVIHATGDISLAQSLVFSPGAVAAGVTALSNGAAIICDVNMVAAGAGPTGARMGLAVRCAVADGPTARLAESAGLTRAAAGMRRLASAGALESAVIAIGNAPSALFEVLRLATGKGLRPAMVVGVPVGFVGAAESKEALMSSGLRHICLPGNRGGSNIAVAAVNALMRLAAAVNERV